MTQVARPGVSTDDLVCDVCDATFEPEQPVLLLLSTDGLAWVPACLHHLPVAVFMEQYRGRACDGCGRVIFQLLEHLPSSRARTCPKPCARLTTRIVLTSISEARIGSQW
jgi:hypothetical protein